MTKVFIISAFFACFLMDCKKKQEPPAVEEAFLNEDELELPEELNMESVEEDSLMDDILFEEEFEADFDELVKPLEEAEEKAPPKSKIAKTELMEKQGKSTSKAKLESPPTGEKDRSRIQPVGDGKFVLQLSIFKNRNGAEKLRTELTSKGYSAYISEVLNPVPELSGSFFRVRVGSFHSLHHAQQFGDENFRPMGYDFWVDLKSHDTRGAVQVQAAQKSKQKKSLRKVGIITQEKPGIGASPEKTGINPKSNSRTSAKPKWVNKPQAKKSEAEKKLHEIKTSRHLEKNRRLRPDSPDKRGNIAQEKPGKKASSGKVLVTPKSSAAKVAKPKKLKNEEPPVRNVAKENSQKSKSDATAVQKKKSETKLNKDDSMDNWESASEDADDWGMDDLVEEDWGEDEDW